MASVLRIEPTMEHSVHEHVSIVKEAFSDFPIENKLGNTADETGRAASAQRHIRAWNEHFADNGTWPAIRCVHRDPSTGTDTTVACAEWFVYPKALPRNDQRGASYLISGIWLPEDEQTKLRQTFRPALDVRDALTEGRGYGLLMYMGTHPEWRRKGAATMCVQWGIDRCRELGIPAYLEASKEGAPVYERQGFEIVDQVRMELDGEVTEFPAMMWQPPTQH